MNSAAIRGTNSNGSIPIIVGPITYFSSFRDDLDYGRHNKIRKLHFGNRSEAIHGCTNTDTRNRSEERRVGKECRSRSWRESYEEKDERTVHESKERSK